MDYKTLETDIVIIGAGAAAIRAAYEASQKGSKRITILSKGKLLHTGSSFFSQVHGWGLQVSMPEVNPEDSPEKHLEEIMERGLGVTDRRMAEILVTEAYDRVQDLIKLGIEFRKQPDGKITQIVGCFSRGRRAIGAVNMDNIRETFKRMISGSQFQVYEHFMALDLLVHDGICHGVLGVDENNEITVIRAKACILASGGGTGIFKHSLNSYECTGDTYGIALRAGLELFNVEFIQSIFGIVHPKRLIFSERCLFYDPDILNKYGRRFIEEYLPEGMKYKDVLDERITHGPFSTKTISRYFDIAVFKEIRKGNGTEHDAVSVNLQDYRKMQETDKNNINVRQWSDFTDIWISWLKDVHGVDVEQTPLEIDHASHAMNGGVKGNEETRTAIPNLFVCGEALAGPHGADRLGGNMMASTQVFGARAGQFAAHSVNTADVEITDKGFAGSRERALEQVQQAMNPSGNDNRLELFKQLQECMWQHAHVIRTEQGLKQAGNTLHALLKEHLPRLMADSFRELKEKKALENSLLTALAIVEAARTRKESRGPHNREDYPETLDSFSKPIHLYYEDNIVKAR